VAGEVQARAALARPISSINLLITSLVWRQDHNGFTHQDPGFLDVVTNKSPESRASICRPTPTACSRVADHCLRSTNYINVIVADKAPHLQYLTMDEAIDHCTKGIGIWDFASNDEGARAGRRDGLCRRHPHLRVARRRRHSARALPHLKIRFVNVVDLFRLMPERSIRMGSPTASSTRSSPATSRSSSTSTPIASLIHKLTYRRTNHDNFHVRGYKEKGNINTPLELAILNQVDRFNLAIDVIDRVPKLQASAAHTKEWLKDQIIEPMALTALRYANGSGLLRQFFCGCIPKLCHLDRSRTALSSCVVERPVACSGRSGLRHGRNGCRESLHKSSF
jgi:xylulose-5-phosphate/fructose-6-phosphate phosphoketolase